MAIRLYKKGDTHVYKGIKCELKNFEEFSVASALKEGWHMSVADIDSEFVDVCTVTPPEKPAPLRGKARRAT